MRQITLDTETTGIAHAQGHRIIEIGCVELIDRKLTGRNFHTYLNPQRAVDEGAFRVHGLSTTFLQDKPIFKNVISDFLAFIEGAELIIHNATFDVGFLNSELKKAKNKKMLEDYCTIVDTLALARAKHPGQRNNLDALCKRYSVDHLERKLHGALLDAEILAYVYLAMTGGQASLFAEITPQEDVQVTKDSLNHLNYTGGVLLKANADELIAHQDFINFLKKNSAVEYWE